MIPGTLSQRKWTRIFLCGIVPAVILSCSRPAELETLTPEASGTVAAPSGSPVVTQLNSSTTDGAYKAGDVISVRVTFGLVATVTGTPRVLLETGNTDRYATYVSGSGGVTLEFSYTVMAGDTSSDLSYVNVNSLELNGGSISAPDATAMNLVLPGLGASGSLSVNRALVIDTTAPVVAGAVTDGSYYNSTTSSPNLTWAAGTDTGGSGIVKYQVAIGTSSGGTQTLTWTDIGNVTTYQVTSGITLVAGSTYYASIRAVDAAGNASTPILGDGWIVDTTPPTSPAAVNDGGASYNTTESNLISWTASTDAASGLAGYELAIGTTAGGTDILGWTSIGSVTSYRRTGLTLSVGTTYYASVRAVDNAGNTTAAQGDGWQVVACDTYGWCPQAYIKAANAQANDWFADSVSISGDTMVASSYFEASNQTTITNGTTASADNSASSAGAVYVYKRTGNTWAQEAYIKAPNAEAFDQFGYSVAIHGDTIVVGARLESSNQTTITNGTTASANNSAANAGAAYVFKRTGVNWAQEAYLKANNTSTGDEFGFSVSIHGDTIAVGAIEETSDQGAVYVYKRTGSSWAQEAYIKAVNANNSDQFGVSVSVHGDSIIVGANNEASAQTTITNGTTASADNSVPANGAAYVYKRTGTTWAQEAYIKPPVLSSNFGGKVVINGDTALVKGGLFTTSVYVFRRTGVIWAHETTLTAVNTAMLDSFGEGLAIENDVAVIGARGEASNQTTVTNGTTASSDTSVANSGAVYVYRRTGTTWAQEAYIKPPNRGGSFGCSVGLSGDTLVAGANDNSSNQTTITNGLTASFDTSASQAGAAYVFTVNRQAAWQQQAYVKAPNAEAGDYFGNGVGLDRDTLIVGANYEDSNQTTITNGATASADNSAADSGAAYIFKRTSGNAWTQEAYLKAPNAEAGDEFGYPVAIQGDTAVVGAQAEDSNQTTITNGATASANNSSSSSGAVYIFKRAGATWTQEAYLKAPNGEANDRFGTSVAIDRDTVVVGASGEDSNQTTITNGTTGSADNSESSAGAIYVFKRAGTNWTQEAYLKAANGGFNNWLGFTVKIDRDTIVSGQQNDPGAGGRGSVIVFKRNGSTWTQEARLTAVNATGMTEYYGASASISGDTIIVGAYEEDSNQTTITNGTTASSDNSAIRCGAAYIYQRSGTTWTQQAYIKAPNAEANDRFGQSVAIYQDTAIVAANWEDSNQTTITNGTTASSDNSASGAGALYVFKRTGTTWAQEAYIKAPNNIGGLFFGISIEISGDTITASSPYESSNQTTITNGTTASSDTSAVGAGAVYIFKR